MALTNKLRAPRNRTIELSQQDYVNYRPLLQTLSKSTTIEELRDHTICQDLFEILDFLPAHSIDMIFVDPPYNMTKKFNTRIFNKKKTSDYQEWIDSWLSKLRNVLKEDGSIYICGDWNSSSAIFQVMERYFIVRNRITWERDKGRGSLSNWKNNSEDIWYGTVSDKYVFNIDAVKVRRKVIAPYRDEEGVPKDWQSTEEGNVRITHPSNIWTDLTVPFWSMFENTDHPTQKPEKLLAKIILASTNENAIILDPFLGSGTTSVVAKKLNRHYVGIELDESYCLLAEKRLSLADCDSSIQGYKDGVFWERNSLGEQKSNVPITRNSNAYPVLFSNENDKGNGGK
jgi:site-specific DNA-methyltransferase (adenine-specific)